VGAIQNLKSKVALTFPILFEQGRTFVACNCPESDLLSLCGACHVSGANGLNPNS
jgi:hypothetical protein